MEVSPKTLREVEFREKKLGGYHPDDVDEFLERVAVGIEVYQEKLRQATERINHLERQLAEQAKQLAETSARAEAASRVPPPPAAAPSPSRETEEQLKRTLLLAQRTADMAVAEAKQEAEEIATKAKAEALSVVERAKEDARKITSEAEKDVQGRVRALETSRVAMEGHVRDLKKFLETEHARLRQGLTDAARILEENVARLPEPPGAPVAATAAPPTAPPSGPPAGQPAPSRQGSARDAVREMLAATTGKGSAGD